MAIAVDTRSIAGTIIGALLLLWLGTIRPRPTRIAGTKTVDTLSVAVTVVGATGIGASILFGAIRPGPAWITEAFLLKALPVARTTVGTISAGAALLCAGNPRPSRVTIADAVDAFAVSGAVEQTGLLRAIVAHIPLITLAIAVDAFAVSVTIKRAILGDADHQVFVADSAFAIIGLLAVTPELAWGTRATAVDVGFVAAHHSIEAMCRPLAVMLGIDIAVIGVDLTCVGRLVG